MIGLFLANVIAFLVGDFFGPPGLIQGTFISHTKAKIPRW